MEKRAGTEGDEHVCEHDTLHGRLNSASSPARDKAGLPLCYI
jgi:hypothetical protein